jgi:hypothetical protein
MRKKTQAKSKLTPKVQSMSDEELIQLRAALEVEMRSRKIAFSIGDVGEDLAIKYFNSTPGLPNLKAAPTGTKNVDALSRNGERYSIKTIWKAKKTGTIYPDPNDKKKQLFEFLLIAQLNDDLVLKSIHQFSWYDFTEVRSWDSRMSAWYIGCSAKNLEQGKLILTSSQR